MMGKVKSECSSQTMISVPPFLTKRNLLQTNIFRNRVSEPSYFAAQSGLAAAPQPPKRCPPVTSIAAKPAGDRRQSSVTSSGGKKATAGGNSKNKPKYDEKQSSDQTLWGWTEDGAGRKGSVSSNVGNVEGAGRRKDSARNSRHGDIRKQSVGDLKTSEDKMVSTDDDSMFAECEALANSIENDFRDDCPVNYSRLNAAVERQGRDLIRHSAVGDSGGVLQRFCAGMSHDASSPFNSSLAFCKTGVTLDPDPLSKVNPSTSTSTYTHTVAPINALKKPDRSLDGMCSQAYKTRHSKRKLPVPLEKDSFPNDRVCHEISSNPQRQKRVQKDEAHVSHGHMTRCFPHKQDALSQKVQELNKSRISPVNVAPQVKALGSAHRGGDQSCCARVTARRQSFNSLNFYDVLDCKSKEVEELFNVQSSFETASSEASQASFRSATEGNLRRSRLQDGRVLHSEPRSCDSSRDPPYFSGNSSPASSHRNSSFKFDPDVFKSTFSVTLEKDSPMSNNQRRSDAKRYSWGSSNVSLNASADTVGLHRNSGKLTDVLYTPPDSQARTPSSYEVTNANEEYLLQMSSPKDVLMMSLQTFKGLNINDPRSRLDCEKFLGHKSTGEKLNNFIRSRTIFNSVSFVQSESVSPEGFTGDDVKISDDSLGFGFGMANKNDDVASAKRSKQSILQCIYKSQNF